MHYYKRNLGDYAKKAGRLSMLQHGAYTLLIDACYDREQFPTMEEAIEWSWASSQAEIEAVEFVLRKFFELENGVYVQSRIKEEIDEYHSKAKTNKRIAIERETNRKSKSTNRDLFVNEAPPNQEPRTNNQEPEKKKKASTKERDLQWLCSLGVDLQHASDWLDVRKSKGAKSLTKTVIDNIQKQCSIAGITFAEAIAISAKREWRGFDASWDWKSQGQQRNPATGKQSARDNYAAEAAAARQKGESHEHVIDGECTVIR